MQLAEEKKSENSNNHLFVFSFTLLFLLVLIRTAWITDDAAITFRTILNFLHGFGPTFNIDERVQAYTHPLWFFTLSLGTLVLGNVFYAAFFISISLATIALGFLLRSASHNRLVLVLIGVAAVLSKAFVDFSTSGLENSLSHFLLLIVVSLASSQVEGGRNRLTVFFLVCSGIYLNRPDLLMIVFPLAIYLTASAIKHPKELLTNLSIGLIPVIIWTAFSVLYYGFPFPNTAYAKLGAGIALEERIIKGVYYLFHTIDRDPVTIFVIVAGLTTGLMGSRLSKALSTGVMLYLVYILFIGGDFMEGRFLTAPFFISLIVFARENSQKASSIAFIISIAILGSASIYPNLIAGSSYSNTKVPDSGIADERGFYFQRLGLLAADETAFQIPPWELAERQVEVRCGDLGRLSVKAGPGKHYVDTCALTDPLLARLPAKKADKWKSGHFYRQLPTNYEESIKQDKNLLSDQTTAHYWDTIRTVTRGPIFDKNRFAEIFMLNLGLIEKPNWEMYQNTNILKSSVIPVVAESDIKVMAKEGIPWNAPGNITFHHAVEIQLTKKINIRSIDLSVDNNDVYEIAGLQNNEWISLATVSPNFQKGIVRHTIILKELARNIDKIRITGKSGDGLYSLGHLRLNHP